MQQEKEIRFILSQTMQKLKARLQQCLPYLLRRRNNQDESIIYKSQLYTFMGWANGF